jgi:putative N6-adenine-specific DNA methylase
MKTAFAVTAPGVEAFTASELGALGLSVDRTEPGGVTFQADARGLYAANLHLRTASRVLVRVAEFLARDFRAVEKRAAAIPWDTFTSPGGVVTFRVTTKKSRLYHQGAVAERLSDAARRAGRAVAEDVADEPLVPGDAGSDAQRLVVRIFRDRCTVSVDASGESLHRRGYRLATAKAPLRENLAAAVLMATGWDGSQPLVDPMCGSGTLLIEGALLARRIPPGLGRAFAFQRWPGFEAETLQGVVHQARDEILERSAPGRPEISNLPFGLFRRRLPLTGRAPAGS